MELWERLIVTPWLTTQDYLLAFLPRLITALFILICGAVAGWLIKVTVQRALHWMKFDAACSRTGLCTLLGRSGITDAPSTLVARLCGGMVIFVFLLLAVNSLDVAILQGLVERFLVYLPQILLAALILLLALLLGNFCGRAVLIACVNAGNWQARLCSRMAYALVVALGVVMALEQLGIGKEAVLIAFAILFGGMVLALALAFGLGGRDLARAFLEEKLRPPPEEDEINHL